MKPINEMTLAECLEALRTVEKFDYDFYKTQLRNNLLADRIHDLTRWIPVGERLPEKDEPVLAFGIKANELYDEDEEASFGLVTWNSVDISYCPDSCYYSVWYKDITHWQRINNPEEV